MYRNARAERQNEGDIEEAKSRERQRNDGDRKREKGSEIDSCLLNGTRGTEDPQSNRRAHSVGEEKRERERAKKSNRKYQYRKLDS